MRYPWRVFEPKRLARLITCKEASRLISQSQDRRLSLRDWVRLRLHLYWCVACQRVESQMGFLRAAMRRYRE